MSKSAKNLEKVEIKVGGNYKLVKISVKEGQKSRIREWNVRAIKLGEIPAKGRAIMGIHEGEDLIGEPRHKCHPISTNIMGTKNIPGIGMRIETQTSVLLLVK